MAKQRESTPDAVVQNYFNYFTEIEEHFQRRRGSLLLLSTIDWALIETWREAGIPLAAVLQGIDAAFDKYDARKNKARVRRVNGLAYCAQEVISAMDAMQEAAVGAAPARPSTAEQGSNRNGSPPTWKERHSNCTMRRKPPRLMTSRIVFRRWRRMQGPNCPISKN